MPKDWREIQTEADLTFASLSPAFYSALRLLEPFGEEMRLPSFGHEERSLRCEKSLVETPAGRTFPPPLNRAFASAVFASTNPRPRAKGS
jgi:hypothetical protein